MTPSDETIQEYIRIMQENYNETLEETTARAEVESLMRLFILLKRVELTH